MHSGKNIFRMRVPVFQRSRFVCSLVRLFPMPNAMKNAKHKMQNGT